MNRPTRERPSRSALVLGGGGVLGIAWELGVLHALGELGLPVVDADLVVGTSAGSTVAAQITSGEPMSRLIERTTDPQTKERELPYNLEERRRFLEEVIAPARDETEARALIGRMALRASTPSTEERQAIIAARLSSSSWPDRDLRIVAVAAESGERAIFTRDIGVSLVDAVAASCAVPGVWPAVTIAGCHYIDGGAYSFTNADLAAGSAATLILTPLEIVGRPAVPFDHELALLRSGGRVLVVGPDEETTLAMGPNPLDPSRRGVMVEAGIRQGQAAADRVADLWTTA